MTTIAQLYLNELTTERRFEEQIAALRAENERLREALSKDRIEQGRDLKAYGDLEDENERLRKALGRVMSLRSWAERWSTDEPHGGPHTTLAQAINEISPPR